MIDHIGIPISDIARSKQFFIAALAPLGYKVIRDLGEAVGMGTETRADFWMGKAQPGSPSHICIFRAGAGLVDAFYQAAIAAGGRDNGKPGIRAQYAPNYYGAFVFDPDGNNIEVVCQ